MENLLNNFKREKIGIVCHDAGGANQIFSLVKDSGIKDIAYFLDGPAKQLATHYFGGIILGESLKSLISKVDILLTGTGWSTLEHEARILAGELNVRSVTVLDHWTNYDERFRRSGSLVLPDELWIVDDYARRLARQQFPHITIKNQKDCYSEQQIKRIRPLQRRDEEQILYLMEPARSTWGGEMPGEFQAFSYFFEQIDKLNLGSHPNILIRPHPSDENGKYDHLLKGNQYIQLEDTSLDVCDSISKVGRVAGCNTFPMTLALLAGRTVYCSLPPWAPKCVLPHSGITHLSRLGFHEPDN